MLTWESAVAPFTGAWIEIADWPRLATMFALSHPSRVRGLKYLFVVALHFGRTGRTLHGCVD